MRGDRSDPRAEWRATARPNGKSTRPVHYLAISEGILGSPSAKSIGALEANVGMPARQQLSLCRPNANRVFLFRSA
jgi:hypothetical protein